MRTYNTKKANSWVKFGNIKNLTKEDFEQACNESESMAHACSKLGINFNTFSKYAKKYGCYKPNQEGKGIKKNFSVGYKFSLEKWNNNEIIPITRGTLRNQIFKLELLPFCCNKCKNSKWEGFIIPLELNHINGNGFENKRSNIELLCPNCHALTDTYRGRNHTKKHSKVETEWVLERKAKPIKEISPKKEKKIPRVKRTREQYFEEKNKKFFEEILPLIKLIRESGINFSISGWRIEVTKLTNFTPQYSGNFIKNNIPEIWETCFKHKK